MINKTPKEQAIDWVKDKVPFSSNYQDDDVKIVFDKAIDIALQTQQKEFDKKIDNKEDLITRQHNLLNEKNELIIKHEEEIKRLRNRIEYLEKEDRPQGSQEVAIKRLQKQHKAEMSKLFDSGMYWRKKYEKALVVQREKIIKEIREWLKKTNDFDLIRRFDEFCKKEFGEEK